MKLGGLRTALMAGFATGALLLTACGSPTQPATPADSGGTAAQKEPTLKRVVLSTLAPSNETNDPRTERGPTNWQFRPFYEYLIGVDVSTGKYVGQLATEWKLEPNGKSFRFKLREGVKFHRGAGDWNADALIDTWKLQTRDKEVNNYALWMDLVASIEKTAPYEAVMHLKSADGTGLLTISEQRGVFYMLNAAHFASLGGGTPTMASGPAAGTGAYMYKERSQGQYVRYERNPDHWSTRPDFPEFEFRFAKEPSTRLASLIAGEVQMVDLPDDLKVEATGRGYKLLEGKLPGLRSFMKIFCCHLIDFKNMDSGWDHPESPLADVRVRKALSKAIDRDQLNKSLFRGKGGLMFNSHFHPTRDGWDPSWETRFKDEYGYDLEAAKKLLADAGYSAAKPLETNILFPSEGYGYSGGEDIQEAIGAMWRKAGVTVNYLTMEIANRRKLTDAQQLFNHIVLGGSSSDTWTGITTYGSAQGTARGTGMEIPEADKLLAKIRTTLDQKEQDAIWRQVGEVFYTQHREIPLFWIPVEAVVDPKYVADWYYPGAITGAWTHVYNIKAVK